MSKGAIVVAKNADKLKVLPALPQLNRLANKMGDRFLFMPVISDMLKVVIGEARMQINLKH